MNAHRLLALLPTVFCVVGAASTRSEAKAPQQEHQVQVVEPRLEVVKVSHGIQQAIVVDLILKNNSNAPVQVTALGGDTWSITLRDAQGTVHTMRPPIFCAPHWADARGLTILPEREYVLRCELRPRHIACHFQTLFFPNGKQGDFRVPADWVYPVDLRARIPKLQPDIPAPERGVFTSKKLRITKTEQAEDGDAGDAPE